MATKELILSTAFKLFASGNFESVSMSQLEKITGLSKGAFYHHFRSKEEIFLQAMDLFFFDPVFQQEDSWKEMDLEAWIRFRCSAASRHAGMLKKQFGIQIKSFHPMGLMTAASVHYPGFYEKIAKQQEAEVTAWEEKIRATFPSCRDVSSWADIFAGLVEGVSIRCVLRGHYALHEEEAKNRCFQLIQWMKDAFSALKAYEGSAPAVGETSHRESDKDKDKDKDKGKDREKDPKIPPMPTLF